MTATTQANLTYVRPWMYPLQERAFFCSERYAICEASTKSGKTVACMCWLAEEAMRADVPGRNYWWVAPIYAQAKIAFRRLRHGLPRHVYVANSSELTLTLANGSVIWFKGADKTDSLFGEDVYAAVIDEASRCKDEAWHAVRSTLTQTRGPVRIIGNVKGRRNWAYQLARRAESGEPGYRYTKITAHDAVAAGVLDAAEIEDAKRTLPEDVFRELYLAEPSDDGGNPFGLAAIHAQIAPLSDQPPAVWGWDLAKSVDWTVGIALDSYGHTCRYERWQGPWETTTDRIVAMTGRTPALVDSTGAGDPVLGALQKRTPGVFEGYHYSQTSKQKLMEGLAVGIQQHDIWYPDAELLPGCVIVSELEEFEYEYTRTGVRYTAPPGLHDDAVNALALARHLRATRPVRSPVAIAGNARPAQAYKQ
jgi:hypothetical protein